MQQPVSVKYGMAIAYTQCKNIITSEMTWWIAGLQISSWTLLSPFPEFALIHRRNLKNCIKIIKQFQKVKL